MKFPFVRSRSRNRNRSLTAEHRLAGRRGPAVRSAGTAPSAWVRLTAGPVGWAGGVVVETLHQEQVVAWIGDALTVKWIARPHLPDHYAYGDDERLDLIGAAVEPILASMSEPAPSVTP